MRKGALKPFIAPIFIPNMGCPHRCIFCEQERITSQFSRPLNRKDIEDTLNKAIHSRRFPQQIDPEIAFYGGTFTNLPLELMVEYLEIVARYIDEGLFGSVRVSTRPDALDPQKLETMKRKAVRTVELGAQSMDNQVLHLSRRGHTAEETVRAVGILKRYGFRVGIQLMPGLPGDSHKKFRETVTKVIQLKPDMVRLYPALVIQGTGLARLYNEGKYEPLGLDQAVNLCTEGCIRLETNGIPVIRIGLHASPSLLEKDQIIAGPWHPAFGFLVRSTIHQKAIEPDLPAPGAASQIRILAPEREIPLVRGHRNQGLLRIEKRTGARVAGVKADSTIPRGRVRVEVL